MFDEREIDVELVSMKERLMEGRRGGRDVTGRRSNISGDSLCISSVEVHNSFHAEDKWQ